MASEKLTIDTPEQIALEFPLAGVGSRFLAVAIDSLIQVALGLAVALVWLALLATVLVSAGRDAGIWTLAIAVLLGFCVLYGYFATFEILWQGQTPGKRMIGLRVIGADGRPITAYQALLRNLLRLVDQLPGLYGIGIVSVLLTARNQRLGDLAAGTVVIHEQQAISPVSPLLVPVPEVARGGVVAPRTGSLQAGRLTDREIALIERFLQRRSDLDVDTRERTGREIAARVRHRLGLTAGEQDEALLERITAEYRASSSYR
jgi:uncharacterized RDD family membrane protein YckC